MGTLKFRCDQFKSKVSMSFLIIVPTISILFLTMAFMFLKDSTKIYSILTFSCLSNNNLKTDNLRLSLTKFIAELLAPFNLLYFLYSTIIYSTQAFYLYTCSRPLLDSFSAFYPPFRSTLRPAHYFHAHTSIQVSLTHNMPTTSVASRAYARG